MSVLQLAASVARGGSDVPPQRHCASRIHVNVTVEGIIPTFLCCNFGGVHRCSTSQPRRPTAVPQVYLTRSCSPRQALDTTVRQYQCVLRRALHPSFPSASRRHAEVRARDAGGGAAGVLTRRPHSQAASCRARPRSSITHTCKTLETGRRLFLCVPSVAPARAVPPRPPTRCVHQRLAPRFMVSLGI